MIVADGTRMVYTQEADCCDDSGADHRLSLTIADGGGGGYVVMRTRRWAIDSEADVGALASAIREALVRAAEVPR